MNYNFTEIEKNGKKDGRKIVRLKPKMEEKKKNTIF